MLLNYPYIDGATNFSADLKHLQKASSVRDAEASREFDYLRDEIAARLVDRINDIQREFPVAVDLGANTGNIARHLDGHGGIKKLYMVENCREYVQRSGCR